MLANLCLRLSSCIVPHSFPAVPQFVPIIFTRFECYKSKKLQVLTVLFSKDSREWRLELPVSFPARPRMGTEALLCPQGLQDIRFHAWHLQLW